MAVKVFEIEWPDEWDELDKGRLMFALGIASGRRSGDPGVPVVREWDLSSPIVACDAYGLPQIPLPAGMDEDVPGRIVCGSDRGSWAY